MNARASGLFGALRLGSLLVLLGAANHALALDVPPLRGHVNDGADLLSSSERAQLEQWLTAYETKTGQQFALLTVPTLDGQPIEDFGIKVAEQWKLGSAKGDEGLILIIAAKDRKTRIEVGYGLEGTLPDAINARVLREVLQPAFRASDYAGGIQAAFGVLMRQASGEAPPAPAREAAPRERRRQGRPDSLWSALSPLILPLILFFLFSGLGGGRRRRHRGFFLGGPFIGGGGGFSGGGGGWSSGGGGGFSGGGGGFGGGGASGDW